jgi:hypothetical protein
VGRTCGTLGEDRKVYKVWRESLKERGHSEDPVVDGIRIDFWGDWLGECIQLTQERGHWWAVVNAVMNLLFLAPRS